MDEAFGGKETEIEGGIYLEVVDVEPGGGAGGFGYEEGQGGTEEGGLYREDYIGPPEDLAEHDWEAAQHEGDQVGYPFEAGGFCGDVEGGAVDRGFAGLALGAIQLASVVFADAPGGVIRGGGDDPDFVASGGQPGGHLSGVLADTSQLGGVVDAVDQNSQGTPLPPTFFCKVFIA